MTYKFLTSSVMLLIALMQTMDAFSQSSDSTTYNRKNSIGVNLSPFASTLLGAGSLSQFRGSLQYKRHRSKFNFRASINAVSNPNSLKSWYDRSEEVLLTGDSFYIHRENGASQGAFDLRLGVEKHFPLKSKRGSGKVSWVLGADLNIGLDKHNRSYRQTYRSYSVDSLTGEGSYNVCWLIPGATNPIPGTDNCVVPEEFAHLVHSGYYSATYLKTGVNVSLGVNFQISQRLNLTAQISPEYAHYSLLRQHTWIDNGEISSFRNNFGAFRMGSMDLFLSYKF